MRVHGSPLVADDAMPGSGDLQVGRAAHLLLYPQYWSWRLSGVMAAEVTSLGTHTDLWRPHEHTYSALARKQGWARMMPPQHPANARLGRVQPGFAAATGINPACEVACGIHDSNASLLTHLQADDPPFSVVSTGTWVICFSVCGKQVALDEARDTLMNVNAFGDPVPSARFMGGRVFAMLGADPKTAIAAADRDAVLDGRIMLLPAIPDDSGPFFGRKGGWNGNEKSLTPGGYLYAVSLYLGMMTAVSLELIGADGPVVVEGPLAANVTFLETLQAVTGRPVMTGGSGVTGTSAGTALLALGRDARITSHSKVAALAPDPRIAAYAAKWRRISENEQG